MWVHRRIVGVICTRRELSVRDRGWRGLFCRAHAQDGGAVSLGRGHRGGVLPDGRGEGAGGGGGGGGGREGSRAVAVCAV